MGEENAMSDDYGDYDDGDFDGDDGDADDNESIEETRHDMWGNPIVQVDGEWMTETKDMFGNTVYMNDDRQVEMTEQRDGDVYMEDTGETFTPMIDPTGLEALHGSAGGGMITERTGLTGNVEYTSDQTGGNVADSDGIGSTINADSDAGSGAMGGELIGGDDGTSVGRNGRPSTQRRRRAPVQTVSPAADPYYRRRKYKEGFGYFFVYFFFFFEMAAIFGSSWLYYTQHFSLGMSHFEAVFGVFLVTVMIYLINALLWLVSGRLFLFFDMKKADLFAWVLSAIMIVTPAIIVLVMLFAG